jgi:hypothetical protein
MSKSILLGPSRSDSGRTGIIYHSFYDSVVDCKGKVEGMCTRTVLGALGWEARTLTEVDSVECTI